MRAEETVWIALSDGVRLAARLWLPDEATPVPAILEYLPYRRRDRHRGDDAILHPGLAAAGYAAIRVDMRGAGDSDGTMEDEYTPQEWRDAGEVIAWIAAQPWCSGAVGLIGLSWSAFNALQIAASRPPALKAIVTVCGSDDRYADDMHYMGGALLNDNLQYGSTLFTWLATPPDPAIVGERWRTMWRQRLEALSVPPAGRWMRHADRDAYWQGGSVCENYARIEVPVLAVGGWADGYTNSVHRLLCGLPGPRRGVIGPGAHAYSHVATPGPSFDFIGLVVRWYDRWLKERDNGVMDEPMLVAWMQDYETPQPQYTMRTGRWVAAATWPDPQAVPETLHLASGGLAPEAPDAGIAVPVRSPATVGLASGEWCPYGWGPDMPGDQREDDAGSACFDTPPLAEAMEILGRPEAVLTLSADRPEAIVAVRLNTVAPNGTVARITYGLLNLAHRGGFDRGRPLVPGEKVEVRVPLKVVGYRVPAGHRLRLAVSTQYWPLTMPLPVAATVTLDGGRLDLPRRGAGVAPPDLGAPWSPPPLEAEVLVPPARGRITIAHDVATGRADVDVVRNLGAIRIAETGLELRALGSERYSVRRDDPGTARSEARREAEFRRDDWQARIVTRSTVTATPTGWLLHATLDAYDEERRIFARSWTIETPRAGAPEQIAISPKRNFSPTFCSDAFPEAKGPSAILKNAPGRSDPS